MSTENRIWWSRQFVQILWVGESDSKKTDKYEVRNKNLDVLLGWIHWYSPWRRYCFFPNNPSLFDSNCLKEIAEACEHRTKLQKNKK